MAIETLPAPATRSARIVGMRCRACGAAHAIGLSYVCPACFGPLEVDYDYAVVGATLTREAIARRAPGIWRYAELLPVDAAADARAGGRVDATARRRAAGARTRPRHGCGSRTTRGTRRSASRTGRWPWPPREPSSSASRRWPARRPATWPARRPPPRLPSGCRPTSSSRPTSSRPRSSTPSPMARRSSRSRAPTTTSTGSAWRSPTRPAGASSTSTSARSTPRVRRPSPTRSPSRSAGGRPTWSSAPVASGAMFTRVARGFEELVELGLIERPADPLRRRPGGRLRPGRDRVGCRDRGHRPGPDARHDRPLAGDRQPGRRLVRRRAGQRVRRLDRGDRRRGHGGRHPRRRPSRGDLPGNGRRRDPGRCRRRPTPRGHPAGRRGRGAADRERAQDARRAHARAR